MTPTRARAIAIGAAVLIAAGGGAAVAGTQLGDPKAESENVASDAAKELGVSPSALTSAIENALIARVDAAVAAGRLTKEQGEALAAKIRSGELPLFAGPGRGFGRHLGHRGGGFGHRGGFAGLDGAAGYLGLTDAALRAELSSGKSLADVAKAKGKSVDGLIDTLVAAATKRIDAAVAAGRVTSEQATRMKADLKKHVTLLVNGARPEGGPGFPGHRHPRGGGTGVNPAFVPVRAWESTI